MNARHLAPALALILAATGAAAQTANPAIDPAAAPASDPKPDPNRCRIQTMDIPVQLIDQRPVSTVKLNGVSVPMLVDSGAFYGMLSTATARQLNLPLRHPPQGFKVRGQVGSVEQLRVTTVKEVGLEIATVKDVDFFVGGNELNAGIMGILGRNFLSAADTEYDLAHGVVRLVFPKGECEKVNLAYWAGEAPVIEVPIESTNRHNDTAVRVRALINGQRVTALMDTGAPMTSLSLAAARRVGVATDAMQPAGRTSGIGTGRADRWMADIPSFQLAGEKVLNNRLPVSDVDASDHGMLLGLDYFLSHRVYVSRLQGKVYATWNGGPIFAQARGQGGEYDPRYAAKAEVIADDDADGFARRGAAALTAGDPKRALEDLNRAVALKPEVANYRDLRSRVHQAMRDPKQALADLDQALTLDPALHEARVRRASLRGAAGDREGASADLAALDAAVPPSWNLRRTMADLHARLNQGPEAIRQYGLWINSHPKDLQLAAAYNSRCWLRARMNVEVAQGLEDCKEAVDRDGDSPNFRSSLGWTYLRLGDASRARKAFDKTIELRNGPWALYGRALARFKLNEADQGQLDLEAARKLSPKIDEDVRKAGFDALAAGVP